MSSATNKSKKPVAKKETIKIVCESCGKKYEATNTSGLHVCAECTARGGPPPKSAQEKTERPRGIICYVCGREFFERSFKIHLPQCLKKRALEQAKLPAHLRSNLQPVNITATGNGADLDQLNEEAFAAYKASLLPCPNCGRTFNGHDRLQVHMRGCKPGSTSRPIPTKSPSPTSSVKKTASPTPTTSNSTTASLRKSVTLSPTPEESLERSPSVSSSVSSLSATPKRSALVNRSIDSTEAKEPKRVLFSPSTENPELVACSKCGRNFNPDRIEKHESVCKGEEKPKPVKQAPVAVPVSADKPNNSNAKWRKQHEDFQRNLQAARTGKAVETPSDFYDDYTPCPHCGRKFSQENAERHISKCALIVNRPKPPPPKKSMSGSPQSVKTPTTTPPKPSVPKSGGKSPTSAIGVLSPNCSKCANPFASSTTKFCGKCGTKRT